MELQKTVFEDAKNLMQNGETWCTGVYNSIKISFQKDPVTGLGLPLRSYCTVGAIRQALANIAGCNSEIINPTSDDIWPYLKIVRDTIHAEYPEYQFNDCPHSCTTNWNDRFGRTFQEIESILDKSHARLQELV